MNPPRHGGTKSSRYQKERTTLVFLFFPYFYSMPLRDISTLLHVIRHIDVSLYFEEMNTSETINTNHGGNQDTQ